MRAGIIYSSDMAYVEKITNELARGLMDQGVSVKLIPDDSTSLSGLAACEYIFIGSYKTSLFKAVTPSRLKGALAKVGGIAGKRAIAFIAKGGMGERKALVNLMNDIEKQGCFIIDQIAFSSDKDAYNFGKTIKLK